MDITDLLPDPITLPQHHPTSPPPSPPSSPSAVQHNAHRESSPDLDGPANTNTTTTSKSMQQQQQQKQKRPIEQEYQDLLPEPETELWEIQKTQYATGSTAQTQTRDQKHDTEDKFIFEDVRPSSIQANNEITAAKSLKRQRSTSPRIASKGGMQQRPKMPCKTPAPIKFHDFYKKPLAKAYTTCSLDSEDLYFEPRVRRWQPYSNSSVRDTSLLSTSIYKMIDDLNQEKSAGILDIERAKIRSENDQEEPMDIIEQASIAEEPSRVISDNLWVDKYTPRSFRDLMSDSKINKEMLAWVSQWNKAVFGKSKANSIEDSMDPLGRPEKRIMLLSGPPGLGKTTLVHVVAKHCGYSPFEINASSDRSADTVKTKIVQAIEMTDIRSKRPNLVIIDEIDGVSGGGADAFIKALVNIVTNEDKEIIGKKKSAAKKRLLRPIICICNDPYVPALKSLRLVAQIVQLRKTATWSIMKRLSDICKREGLSADSPALNMLVELTDGDVRSCLNTLQFAKQKNDAVTIDFLLKSNIGNKDVQRSLFAVWERIFTTRSKWKNVTQANGDSHNYVSHIVGLVDNCSDPDKVTQGCMENMLKLDFLDQNMQKVPQVYEWMWAQDMLCGKALYAGGGQGLASGNSLEYHGYIIAALHRLCSTSAPFKIEFPRKDYEAFVATQQNMNILQSFYQGVSSKIQRHFTPAQLPIEFMSPLLRIVSPVLRPVNPQLMKTSEKETLARLVTIFADFNLTYRQDKGQDGLYTFELEPPIQEIVSFDGVLRKGLLPHTYPIRRVIAHETTIEHMRRAEALLEAKSGPLKGPSKYVAMTSVTDLITSIHVEPEQTAKDFFGRVLEPRTLEENGGVAQKLTIQEAERKRRTERRIWYKFNEGFSNAVKMKRTLADIL